MVKLGLEVFLADHLALIHGQRIGIITNQTGINPRFESIVDLLKDLPAVQVKGVLGPEHGFFGIAQDMEPVGPEKYRELPVYSLYGNSETSLSPALSYLEALDCLIFDIQDIGSRYYTFIYTMALAMSVCAKRGKAFIVLDRPNPITGTILEGNLNELKSFVGYHPLLVRHGMTTGELAALFNKEFQIQCRLQVIPMKGWKRQMWYDETGLPWVSPSPNMPTLETATVYPGLCLLEGTELSEGRGTTRPFEYMGAPFIDPYQLTKELNQLDHLLPGVFFRPSYFKPCFQKFAGQTCGGVQIHITDRQVFKPFLTGIALISTVYRLYPAQFQWRHRAYEFVSDIPAFDLLCGNTLLRSLIETGVSLADIAATYQKDRLKFQQIRSRYLLYND